MADPGSPRIQGTTILAVRRGDAIALAGDGQVTLQHTVLKGSARKVRRLPGKDIVAGFAGATADALTLFELFEGKMQAYGDNITRAAVEVAKSWRTDKMLRNLEAMMIVAGQGHVYLISGNGDVIEPDGVSEDGSALSVGSGGTAALAAAKALLLHTELSAEDIARAGLAVAASIDIYTNDQIVVEVLGG